MRSILTTENDRRRVIEAIEATELGYMVTISKPPRTAAQNRFYWSILTACAEQLMGQQYTQDIWHEWAKTRFLPSRVVELPGGQVKEIEASLTVSEFSDMVEQLLQYALEKGLVWTDEMKDAELDLRKINVHKQKIA
jgi:hypothetical protein